MEDLAVSEYSRHLSSLFEDRTVPWPTDPTTPLAGGTLSIQLYSLVGPLLHHLSSCPVWPEIACLDIEAWFRQVDPTGVIFRTQGPDGYDGISSDGLCGGHAYHLARAGLQSTGPWTRDNPATRTLYRQFFQEEMLRLQSGSWPSLVAPQREAHIAILQEWIWEFDSPSSHRVSPNHWFTVDLLRLLGARWGLRLWAHDLVAGFRYTPAIDLVSARLSHVIELVDPPSPLRHFAFGRDHFFPCEQPVISRQDWAVAWPKLMAETRVAVLEYVAAGALPSQRLRTRQFGQAPWESLPNMSLPRDGWNPWIGPPVALTTLPAMRNHSYIPFEAEPAAMTLQERRSARAATRAAARAEASAPPQVDCHGHSAIPEGCCGPHDVQGGSRCGPMRGDQGSEGSHGSGGLHQTPQGSALTALSKLATPSGPQDVQGGSRRGCTRGD